MQETINGVNALALRVKAKIEALDKANETALQKKGQGLGSASERTRSSITGGEGSAIARVRSSAMPCHALPTNIPCH